MKISFLYNCIVLFIIKCYNFPSDYGKTAIVIDLLYICKIILPFQPLEEKNFPTIKESASNH